jgi:hypothetical protein
MTSQAVRVQRISEQSKGNTVVRHTVLSSTPVPFNGGGMIGYTLATIFYQVALEASLNVENHSENYLRAVTSICDAARLELDN